MLTWLAIIKHDPVYGTAARLACISTTDEHQSPASSYALMQCLVHEWAALTLACTIAPDCDDLRELRLGNACCSVMRNTSLHLCERQHLNLPLELPYPVLFASTENCDSTAAPPLTLQQRILDDPLGSCTAAESARDGRDAACWLSETCASTAVHFN
jgi:hypothetical protein